MLTTVVVVEVVAVAGEDVAEEIVTASVAEMVHTRCRVVTSSAVVESIAQRF